MSVSLIRFGDIDIIGNIDSFGNIKTYCKRERCVSISAYSSGCHLPIGDFETFHYSPLRGNFAAYLCERQWKALRCRALTSH